jgi:hypothetical protein
MEVLYEAVSGGTESSTVADLDTAQLEIRLCAGFGIIGTVGKSYRLEYENTPQGGRMNLPSSLNLWFDWEANAQVRPQRAAHDYSYRFWTNKLSLQRHRFRRRCILSFR